jgi:hypothetical protein
MAFARGRVKRAVGRERELLMSASRTKVLAATCACGRVELEAVGTPITSVVCYCDDCRAAASRIEALPGAPAVVDPDGGTAYVVYRKDRVACTKGAALLESHKLLETSPTKRVVASCCNSAMFLGFDDAKHWVDIYSSRVDGCAPPVQMRVCTRFRQVAGDLPGDAPSHTGYPLKFMAKLMGARIAMLLHR